MSKKEKEIQSMKKEIHICCADEVIIMPENEEHLHRLIKLFEKTAIQYNEIKQ